MAVSRIASVTSGDYEWRGKSTDTKPTAEEGANINDIFWEMDTGKIYFFDTDDDWKVCG